MILVIVACVLGAALGSALEANCTAFQETLRLVSYPGAAQMAGIAAFLTGIGVVRSCFFEEKYSADEIQLISWTSVIVGGGLLLFLTPAIGSLINTFLPSHKDFAGWIGLGAITLSPILAAETAKAAYKMGGFFGRRDKGEDTTFLRGLKASEPNQLEYRSSVSDSAPHPDKYRQEYDNWPPLWKYFFESRWPYIIPAIVISLPAGGLVWLALYWTSLLFYWFVTQAHVVANKDVNDFYGYWFGFQSGGFLFLAAPIFTCVYFGIRRWVRGMVRGSYSVFKYRSWWKVDYFIICGLYVGHIFIFSWFIHDIQALNLDRLGAVITFAEVVVLTLFSVILPYRWFSSDSQMQQILTEALPHNSDSRQEVVNVPPATHSADTRPAQTLIPPVEPELRRPEEKIRSIFAED